MLAGRGGPFARTRGASALNRAACAVLAGGARVLCCRSALARRPLPRLSTLPPCLPASRPSLAPPPPSKLAPPSELCDLVKEVQPAARRPAARLSFAFVYPDRRGKNVMRQVR